VGGIVQRARTFRGGKLPFDGRRRLGLGPALATDRVLLRGRLARLIAQPEHGRPIRSIGSRTRRVTRASRAKRALVATSNAGRGHPGCRLARTECAAAPEPPWSRSLLPMQLQVGDRFTERLVPRQVATEKAFMAGAE
jgi:hypothetical protein